jgi:hypothetical protein
VQVASTLAHACPPLVVVGATIINDAELCFVADGLVGRGVEFAHVVVRVTEENLHARAHHEGGDPDRQRQALQYARQAALEVDGLPADAKITLSGRPERDVVRDLSRALVRRGWLDRSGSWTPAPAAARWADA